MAKSLSCLVFALMLGFVSGSSNSSYVELDLKSKLLPNGELLVRPVKDQSKAVEVKMGMALNQIIDMDEVNQILTSSIWIRINWNNPFMKWNPTDYQNISVLNLPPSTLWTPDLVLINSVHDERSSNLQSEMDTSLQVASNGDIQWNCPFIFKTSCLIDITDFPFDYQSCLLEFTSWTYNGYALNLSLFDGDLIPADTSAYTKNGEWILEEMESDRVVKLFAAGVPFPHTVFKINIQRRTKYYIFNLLVPCLAITFLAYMSFLLPPDAGERVGLVITVILSMSVFLLIVAESVPRSSLALPLISQFFIALMMEIAVSLVFTCVLLRMHYIQHDAGIPKWLRFLVYKIIAPVVFWYGCGTKPCCGSNNLYVDNVYLNTLSPQPTQNGEVHFPKDSVDTLNADAAPQKTSSSKKLNVAENESLVTGIKYLADRKRDKARQETLDDEWKDAALVIDRLLFGVFVLTSILTCIIILSNARFY